MCGRFSLFANGDVVEERFDATFDFDYRPRYNVSPGGDVAVVPNDRSSSIVEQRWGLVPGWDDPDGDGPRPINARAETVAEKSTFRAAFDSRRCLVLADGFYEWSGERGSKQPYRVHLDDDGLFAMAGIWNRHGNGRTVESVAILTTDADETVSPIHDRMPVILDRDEEAGWLSGSADEARTLLDPFGGDGLRAYPISTAVNDPGNDAPDVLVEADSEQSALDGFG